MKFSQVLSIAGIALASHLMAGSALADTYPSRAVRIIVPYGTGGGSDVLARQIAARLQTIWGQGIAVDNRAGASGNIGTEAVVRSPADGYTLLLQNSTMVVNPAVAGKLNYDPEKDLTPIMLLGLTPIALVSHQGTNIKTLKDLVDYSRANLVAPHIKTGKLNGIGVSTAARYQLIPQLPSFEEQGLKPLDFSIWYALMGPAKMPPEVVARIHADVQKVLAEPAIKENLSNAGVEPFAGNGAELSQLIKADLARYAQLAKSANIKAE